MHARRVGRQHQADHRRLCLVADWHAALLDAVAPGENVEIETAGQGLQHFAHVRQHEVVLVHVRPAHVLGQAGGRRLVVDEVLRGLAAVAEGQVRGQVEVGGLDHHGDQLAGLDLAQDVAGALGAAHVALDQAGVRLVQRRQLLAGFEVDDRRLLERLVGLAPTDGGDVDHAGYL